MPYVSAHEADEAPHEGGQGEDVESLLYAGLPEVQESLDAEGEKGEQQQVDGFEDGLGSDETFGRLNGSGFCRL
jgi:hypothetical protein